MNHFGGTPGNAPNYLLGIACCRRRATGWRNKLQDHSIDDSLGYSLPNGARLSQPRHVRGQKGGTEGSNASLIVVPAAAGTAALRSLCSFGVFSLLTSVERGRRSSPTIKPLFGLQILDQPIY